jgi:FkbM family methyltransferase
MTTQAVGHQYRRASPGERLAAGSARRVPPWLRRGLKRAFAILLDLIPGDHLVCRLPGGESLRVDPEYRHLAWNASEYSALKAHVTAGSTVLDVGANVGAYTLLFATWAGQHGRVLAFEPAAASRAGLLRHLAINNLTSRVEVRAEAVSDQNGTASFLEQGTSGSNRLVSGAMAGASSVRSVTIDEVCAAGGLAPDVIKIDVEGAEVAVLRGARRTIASRGASLALFVELHPTTWPSLGLSRDDVEAELRHQGLGIESLPGAGDPWSIEGVSVRLRPAPCAS